MFIETVTKRSNEVPIRIEELLSNCVQTKAVVCVTIPDTASEFLSVILDIDMDRKILYMDELNPGHGHQALLHTRRLHAKIVLNGATIDFDTEIKHWMTKKGTLFYELTWPSQLKYQEKRKTYRTPVGKSADITVTIKKGAQALCEGTITNVSGTGISTSFSPTPHLPKEGDIILGTILYGGSEILACEMKTHHQSVQYMTGMILMGFEFISINIAAQHQLARLAADLQRQKMQSTSNLDYINTQRVSPTKERGFN